MKLKMITDNNIIWTYIYISLSIKYKNKYETPLAKGYPASPVRTLPSQNLLLDHATPSLLWNSSIFSMWPPVNFETKACPNSWKIVLITETYFPKIGIFSKMKAKIKNKINLNNGSIITTL